MTVKALMYGADDIAPVGVSLKSDHYQDILANANEPSINFLELHAENYMVDGGTHLRVLNEISEKYPLSIHGVGMSLGSADGLDNSHLARFRRLVSDYSPVLISEHLAWSVQDGHYLNDLLPLPLNEESLKVVCRNVDQMQQVIGRQILIENPSSYMAFKDSTMSEMTFLSTVIDRTNCGLLLDVNNIFVSAQNMGWDMDVYLAEIPGKAVGEIHLAGHLVREIDGKKLRIDDHGSAVSDDVWDLYSKVINQIGCKPTLIEWDNNLPSYNTLISEADLAKACMEKQVSAERLESLG